MCQRYRAIVLFFIFFYSNSLFANTYPVLDKGYSLGISGGVGSRYLSNIDTILPTVVFDSEFIVINSFGLTLTNYSFINNKEDFFFGNNLGLSITIRPMFAIRFIKNKFSKNYYTDFFYNSISLNFGGVLEYTKFSRNEIVKNITTVGTKIGLSFSLLMYYDKYTDFYLKTSIDYNFLQNMRFYDVLYDMSGFYVQVVLGISFRFGDSIDWLIGENENDKKVKIKFKK
jgi:hypothetical protein